MAIHDYRDALTPYERWMVRSNLNTIRTTGVAVEDHCATLRANGYLRIAAEVEQEYKRTDYKPKDSELPV